MRLIMAKSRIAPMNKVSTPRMELNGAVLSKRCRGVIQKEMRYKFDRVIHLVDSETVLQMLHKTSCRFQIYEGVRVGEIQSAMKGNLGEWAWIAGSDNTADWLTRGRVPKDLDHNSDWFQGPPSLRRPYQEWNIRYCTPSDEAVPGEKKIVNSNTAEAKRTSSVLSYENISSYDMGVRVIGRLLGIAREKSFSGGSNLNLQLLKEAEEKMIKEAQRGIDFSSPDYESLNPAQNQAGIWNVGVNRLREYNPLSAITDDLPVFLPTRHPLTRLAMTKAHKNGHRGRDGTLATFRLKFWTPRGSHVAKAARDRCQLCKRRDAKLMNEVMGSLPVSRLRPSTPFQNSMVDLCGPFTVRGEVQKRTSSKAWIMLITDLVSRAVHAEVMAGYDASSALLALSRFSSLRGWSSKMYSDPGSQLLAVSKEINEAAVAKGLENGMEWIVGPADSPWRQGAVESLIGVFKRAMNMAAGNKRLSLIELQTVSTEAANVVNERPIGRLPDLESQINVLTPNCLLLGRATAVNPVGWQPDDYSMKTRYQLVATVGAEFWKHWTELYAPSLLKQQKWHKETQRQLKVGDVVMVADQNTLRGEYRLALVTEVHTGKDGKVRTATCSYKNFRVGEKLLEYNGAPYRAVKRSIQRLAMLVEVE